MSRRTVEQWRRDVFKAPASPNVRLLLLYMAETMRERDKHVSIPRSTMAKALGWSEQRVSERIAEAVELGFLYPKSPGYRGHTAEYQGTWPDVPIVKSVRKNRNLSGLQNYGRNKPGKRPYGTDATTRADLFLRGNGGDVGSEEEAEVIPVRSRPTGCPLHEHTGCPSYCTNPASREASA